MKKLLFACSFILFGMLGFSQQIDSLRSPSLPEPKLKLDKEVKISDWPNPKKAILFAIIPGGGQVYNRRWWKLPLVYGAMTAGVLVIDYNRDFYLRYREALNLARAGETHEFTPFGLSTTTLKIRRDLANKFMQQAYLATFAIYLLQGTEAFVDAHLRTFDMDEDLSLKLRPSVDFLPQTNQPVVGMTISIPISR
jgi:hypothetical protein